MAWTDTLDCMLSPIACATASAAIEGQAAGVAVQKGGARAVNQAVADGGNAISSAGGALVGIEQSATAPLSQIASTSMWITIGIIVVAVVFLIVFGYIVLKVI